MRDWLGMLHRAVDGEQRSLIENVLKDAIPEFAIGSGPATAATTLKIEQSQT